MKVQEQKNNNEEITKLKNIINKILGYWYLFVISFIFFFGLGVLYLRYAAPVYQVGSLLTLSNSGSRGSNTPTYAEGLEISNRLSDLRNEMLTLSSYPLLEKVIKNLGFEISYFYKEDYVPFQKPFFKHFPNLILKEMYKDVPFEVIIDKHHIQPIGTIFYINIIDNKEFYLSAHDKYVYLYDYNKEKFVGQLDRLDIEGKYKFGEEIKSSNYSFKILLNSSFTSYYEGMDLYFTFHSVRNLAMQYKKRLEITSPSYEGRTISIVVKTKNIQKGLDFLKGLEDEYLQENLNKKYETAQATIENINRQIMNISDSLYSTEKKLKDFKRRYNVMNIQEKAVRVAEQKQVLENQKIEKSQQLKFYKELYKNFKENKNSSNLITPTSMGVNDPALNAMVEQLIQKNIERKTLEQQNQTRTAHYRTLVKQIEDLKTSIAQNIQFFISNAESSLKEIDNQLARINYDQNILPQTQLQLRDIERKSSLNDELFTYLLRKRSEARIAMASLKPDMEIIEPPYYIDIISPSVIKTLFVVIFLSFAFPGAYIFLLFFFDNKVRTTDDIREILDIPILGHVLHNNKKGINVIKDAPMSPIAESIRGLRTNILAFKKDLKKLTILVTSLDSNEGKSFISFNVASGFAVLKKKTIIIGFDLRKPNELFKYPQSEGKGLLSFLKGEISDINEIILHTDTENLDIIPAGNFPDDLKDNSINPTELIDSEKTRLLLEKIKHSYDIIVMDTPPLGPVTDALILMSYSDVNLFVVRQNFTNKNALKKILTDLDDKYRENLVFIFNDIKKGKKYGYSGGYTYRYYGTTQKKRSLFRFLKLKR